MGYLAEKEKFEREKKAKGGKPKKPDQVLTLKMARSNRMEIHVASKKDLEGPELYLRKDSEGNTHIVVAGLTGSPAEVMKFITENGISIETGVLMPQVVYDEGRTRGGTEKFAKVNSMAAGQSAIKCTKPPVKLEELEFHKTFELKVSEESGSLKMELVQKEEVPKNGFGVFEGCMTKPSAKRLKEFTDSCPGTSAEDEVQVIEPEPLPKRRRTRK